MTRLFNLLACAVVGLAVVVALRGLGKWGVGRATSEFWSGDGVSGLFGCSWYRATDGGVRRTCHTPVVF